MRKGLNFSENPSGSETGDVFLAAVPWTEHRTNIILLHEHAGRRYVRVRTFHRNKKHGYWYVGKKYYTLPIGIAKDVGRAIATAAKGKPFTPQPAWWLDFQEAYRRYWADRAEADETPDVDRSNAPL